MLSSFSQHLKRFGNPVTSYTCPVGNLEETVRLAAKMARRFTEENRRRAEGVGYAMTSEDEGSSQRLPTIARGTDEGLLIPKPPHADLKMCIRLYPSAVSVPKEPPLANSSPADHDPTPKESAAGPEYPATMKGGLPYDAIS
jgi:hypothetical protein